MIGMTIIGALERNRHSWEGRMTIGEQVRAYSIKSHGATIARTHLHDWLILILLVVIEIILNVISPFYRFVGKDMMTDLKYPLKSNTVPVWAVPIYAVLLPIIIFNIRYFRRRDVHDLHHAVLGLLYSVLITGVITDAIKDGVGRPRPDFFWRCFPDGQDLYDLLGDVKCNGDPAVIKEGHKSFPSGHTSCSNSDPEHTIFKSWAVLRSFAGLGFLSLYLSGKIQVFDRRGHAGKLCVVFLPLLMAALVGVSRVDDYWHHWQDVFAGAILGLFISFVCYLQFFPSPHSTKGWGPYSYFRAVDEESQASSPTTNGMNLALVHQRQDHEIAIG